jgi:hypothetical protein
MSKEIGGGEVSAYGPAETIRKADLSTGEHPTCPRANGYLFSCEHPPHLIYYIEKS